MSRQDIVDRYVFFTAGGCGPCRFGMYEAEYRLALRNAGFRRLPGPDLPAGRRRQGEHRASPGFKLSPACSGSARSTRSRWRRAERLRVRGPAVRGRSPARPTAALDEAMALLADDFRAPRARSSRRDARCPRGCGSRARPPRKATGCDSRRADEHARAPVRARSMDDAMAPLPGATRVGIEVDRLRVKPVVKITGEFWAQTTEGDGNFRMFEFLEREGAQVVGGSAQRLGDVPAPAAARARCSTGAAWTSRGAGRRWARWRRGEGRRAAVAEEADCCSALGERDLPRTGTTGSCRALGDVPHPLVDQEALARARAARSTTAWRAAARGTSRSARTSTTRRKPARTWCSA